MFDRRPSHPHRRCNNCTNFGYEVTLIGSTSRHCLGTNLYADLLSPASPDRSGSGGKRINSTGIWPVESGVILYECELNCFSLEIVLVADGSICFMKPSSSIIGKRFCFTSQVGSVNFYNSFISFLYILSNDSIKLFVNFKNI